MAFNDLLYPLPANFGVPGVQVNPTGTCYLGGFAWVYISQVWRMYRFRISDGVIVDFTGAATTYSDVNAYRVISTGYSESPPVTDGLEVVQLTSDGSLAKLTRYSPTDMTVIGTTALPGSIANCISYKGVYDGIDSYWFALYNYAKVLRVNATTMAVSLWDTVSQPWDVTWDGTHLWVSTIAVGFYNVYKYTTAGAVVSASPVGGPCRAIHFDGTYIWAGLAGFVTRIRASDSQFIDSTGAVVGDYTLARFYLHEPADVAAISSYGDTLFVTNDNAGLGSSVNRFRLLDGLYGGYFPGFARDPRNISMVGTRMIVTNNLGTGLDGFPQVALMNFDVPPCPPFPPTEVLTGAAQGCNVLPAPTGGQAAIA